MRYKNDAQDHPFFNEMQFHGHSYEKQKELYDKLQETALNSTEANNLATEAEEAINEIWHHIRTKTIKITKQEQANNRFQHDEACESQKRKNEYTGKQVGRAGLVIFEAIATKSPGPTGHCCH